MIWIQSIVNKTSEALLEKMKVKRFITLFQILDSNGDGLVSAQKIDISQLKPELLEIMTPLFWEMEELGQTLDWHEFVDAWKLLYNTLNICDKNKLLAINHKWEKERQSYVVSPSFVPEINKKSSKLAQYRKQDGEKVEDWLARK